MSERPEFVTVLVHRDLLAELKEWSAPVQVKIIATPGHGTGYEMVARTVSDTP